MIIKNTRVGKVKDIEKLKRILIYLISNLETVKYKTELIKLWLILDYRYCKKLNVKENPTTVDYVKYNYGPYSDSFVEALEQLKHDGILLEIGLQFGAGFSLAKDPGKIDIEDSVKVILDSVIKDYGKKPLKELKSFIYDLPEFKNTEFGEVIVIN